MDNEIQETAPSMTKCQTGQESSSWMPELEHQQSLVESLQEKLTEVRVSIQCSDTDAKKELDLLWRRAKTAATFLTYLKTKVRLMSIHQLAYTSSGVQHQEGVGLIDKHRIPLSEMSKDVDLSSHESSNEDAQFANSSVLDPVNAHDGEYVGEIIKSVHMVSDVMESLVKRVIVTETEAAYEKQKVSLCLEEIARKTLQIENLSAKVVEMEKCTLGTNGVLSEMRQKVKEMVEETSRQRQRAAENEDELCRVKQDFESLSSYVSSLISVREILLSSEKQVQTMERLFDRLVEKNVHLETEKLQKEAEVQKLMTENVTLRAMLDEKEAQLLAMNEQCKFMALNCSRI